MIVGIAATTTQFGGSFDALRQQTKGDHHLSFSFDRLALRFDFSRASVIMKSLLTLFSWNVRCIPPTLVFIILHLLVALRHCFASLVDIVLQLSTVSKAQWPFQNARKSAKA